MSQKLARSKQRSIYAVLLNLMLINITHTHTHTHTSISIYLYLSIYTNFKLSQKLMRVTTEPTN